MEAMESGLVVDPNTTVDDPWAIVELVDDSKPWSGKEPIYDQSSVDFFHVSNFRSMFIQKWRPARELKKYASTLLSLLEWYLVFTSSSAPSIFSQALSG